MESIYSESFRLVHQLMDTGLPIHVWAECIGKHLPDFQHASDIYAPVQLRIKLSGRINAPNGTALLKVPAHDADWYPELKKGLAEMIQSKQYGPEDFEVVNYDGQCISEWSPMQLAVAGELDP